MARPKKKDAEPAESAVPQETSSTYTVLARRYRPQQFDDCIGQEHVTRSLISAIEGNRVGHAYLFTGSRGVGKTSMARIFAKALNCVKGPTAKPCDECDNCLAIAVGEDVDVIEIDGASNRGIDEVRELRQAIGYRPSRSRYKIYIIDEVHMLSKDAFNALLKTLEEPPGHVKFLFATTEVQKIPITILSRCQRFDFAGIELERIVARLEEIVTAEGMKADRDALELVARRAGGSMRDSQSLLDQLLAFGSDVVTAADVHRLLGTADDERVVNLIAALLAGDAADCFQKVEQAVLAGVQLGEFVDQIIGYLRDLLVLGVSKDAPLATMSNRWRQSMAEQTKLLSTGRLLEWMDLLAATRGRMRGNSLARTLVEITLVRICKLDEFISVARGEVGASPTVRKTSAAPAPNPADTSKKNEAEREIAPVAHQQVQAPAPSKTTLEFDSSNPKPFWNAFISSSLASVDQAMLKLADRIESEGTGVLCVYFPAEQETSFERISDPEKSQEIQKLFSDWAGKAIRVKFLRSQAPVEKTAPANSTVDAYYQSRQMANELPLVKKAERLLDAKVDDVRQLKRPSRPASPDSEEIDST